MPLGCGQTLKTEEIIMASAENILFEGLKSMVFYDQRFAKPLIGAYAGAETAPYAYLTRLFVGIPLPMRADAAKLALLRIVNDHSHCPSPKDVRIILAEAVLKTQQLDIGSLYEKAKLFLAFPPTTETVASEWINKIIFSAIRHLGRERFMVASPEDWSATVADVIFGDADVVEYKPSVKDPIVSIPHDFRKLLDSKQ